jgi:DNA-binding transcriptional LysR family regulator
MEILDSRRLRHFLAVYDMRTIGQAADKLCVTQPALSKSIRQLEEDLQAKLFDRTPLGVVPTVFGELLAQHAKIIRSEMRHAELEIAGLRGAVRGQVTIGVGPSIAANLMPIAARRLRLQRPGIRLTVTEGLVDTLIPALRRGELDLAVGSWPRVADADLTAEVLMQDHVCVVAGLTHPLAGKDRVELGDLLEYPWSLPPESQRWRQLLEETFLAQGHGRRAGGLFELSATAEFAGRCAHQRTQGAVLRSADAQNRRERHLPRACGVITRCASHAEQSARGHSRRIRPSQQR